MTVSFVSIKADQAVNFEIPAPIFSCGIISEIDTSEEYKNSVTDYLYNMGCLYLCTWGNECADWHDAMDWSTLCKHDYDVPDDEHCMTSWHENDPVEEMLFFLKVCANTYLESAEFEDTLILYVGNNPDKDNILKIYETVENLD